MAFRVGMQPGAEHRQRGLEADGGQHVLQGFARAAVQMHVVAGHDRQVECRAQIAQGLKLLAVTSVQKAARADPQTLWKQGLQEAAIGFMASRAGKPDAQAFPQGGIPQVRPFEAVVALVGLLSCPGDQAAEAGISHAIRAQQQEFQAIGQGELAADDEVKGVLPGRAVGTHDPRHGAFIGQRQRAIAELSGARHQFLGMRGAFQEAEVGEAVQFRKSDMR